jgi:hypothetical protein
VDRELLESTEEDEPGHRTYKARFRCACGECDFEKTLTIDPGQRIIRE